MTTDYTHPKLSCRINLLLVGIGLTFFIAPSSLGQASTTTSASSANAPYVATMTFDVASVRENKDGDMNAGVTMSGQFVPHTTILRVINWTVEYLTSYAYGVDFSQIVGAPKWPTLYVIEAKSDSEADAKIATLTKEQQLAEQQHMLQALLTDRFKLKTHWESKEGDVYNLRVAKGGPKFGTEGSMPPSADELKTFGDRPIPPLHQKKDGEGYDLIAHAYTMNEWAGILTGQFGRTVIDKTGLTGKYDFVLKYKGRWDRDRNVEDLDPMPPMDRALQEQLGLKVEAAKGPSKILVINHIEKPSEN